MRLPDKTRIRGALRKLRAIPCAVSGPGDVATAAQEALDFAAMLAGLKPVYVLGRGFDDAAWIDGVGRLAAAQKLPAIDAPFWIAPEAFAGLPEWFIAGTLEEFAGLTATYICKARVVASEIVAIAEAGRITLAQEARLLGFPECCVADHYARARVIHGIRYEALCREGVRDTESMRRLLRESGSVGTMTDAERAAIGEALSVVPCPFTSFNMCERCAGDRDSPAAGLARRYADLAMTLDPALFDLLSPGQ